MEAIQTFLNEFDLGSLLPKLDGLMANISVLMRIIVLAGPALLLFLGLWYFLLPPREANHYVGYRFFWGMSSVEAWLFMQKIAGILWALLGLGFGAVILLLSRSFAQMDLMTMVSKVVLYLFWELGAVVISCFLIDLTVILAFDSKGVLRKEKRLIRALDKAILRGEMPEEFLDDYQQESAPESEPVPILTAETEDVFPVVETVENPDLEEDVDEISQAIALQLDAAASGEETEPEVLPAAEAAPVEEITEFSEENELPVEEVSEAEAENTQSVEEASEETEADIAPLEESSESAADAPAAAKKFALPKLPSFHFSLKNPFRKKPAPEEVPEEAPEEITEEAPEVILAETPETLSDEPAAGMPELVPDDLPLEIAEAEAETPALEVVQEEVIPAQQEAIPAAMEAE